MACTIPKKLKSTLFKGPVLFCKTRSIYSNRAVSKSIHLTFLLEYIELFCCMHLKKLICAPRSHSCFLSLYHQQQRIRTEVWAMTVCKQLGIIVVWHCLSLRYKVSDGSDATRPHNRWTFEHNRRVPALFKNRFINYIALGSQRN